MDYACLDNIGKRAQLDDYYRLTMNYSRIATSLYEANPNGSAPLIGDLVKRHIGASESKEAITLRSFRHMLKFRQVTKSLSSLLNKGGLWSINLEKVYEHLVKFRVEKVIYYLL